MNLKELKANLLELKNEGIYDYQTKNNYSQFFFSLYRKKEAIDFLIKKINVDISILYDRIDPNSPPLTEQKTNPPRVILGGSSFLLLTSS